MFGERIDYALLRPLTHDGGKETEEQLNSRYQEVRPFDLSAAEARLGKLLDRFDGHMVVQPGVRWLDVGCGRGDIDLALVASGATDVTGVDPIRRNIDAANIAAEQAGMETRARFICADIHAFTPHAPFDVVMSHEALEHIGEPGRFIARLRELVVPGGIIYLAFGPLFHSPFGDHLDGFFRLPIPWRGVLFNERALMRLREERFRPGDPVRRFEELAGGMNKMRYSEFLSYLDAAGLAVEHLGLNPQLDAIPGLRRAVAPLMRLPGLRDYLAMSVYAKLRARG